MKTLFLYTTLGCHLCEKAKALAWPLLQYHGYRLQEIEIADDNFLLEEYALRIPVMRIEHGTTELGWPFDQQALEEYLQSVSAPPSLPG